MGDKYDLKDICWQLFLTTGQINYYMLYKSLKEK